MYMQDKLKGEQSSASQVGFRLGTLAKMKALRWTTTTSKICIISWHKWAAAECTTVKLLAKHSSWSSCSLAERRI